MKLLLQECWIGSWNFSCWLLCKKLYWAGWQKKQETWHKKSGQGAVRDWG